jgi:hypothetical protein
MQEQQEQEHPFCGHGHGPQPATGRRRQHRQGRRHRASEKDAKLAQKLGQLQPFLAVLPPECMGQLASFGPT